MGALVIETEQTLHVQRIDSLLDLEQLTDAWSSLAPVVPFLTNAWAVAWWRHYQQQSGELFTLAVRDAAGSLIGLAPWHRQIRPAGAASSVFSAAAKSVPTTCRSSRGPRIGWRSPWRSPIGWPGREPASGTCSK